MATRDKDEAKGKPDSAEDEDEDDASTEEPEEKAPPPAKTTEKKRETPRKKPWALLAVIAVVLAVVTWVYATAPSHIVLDQGVEVTSVTLPQEVAPNGTLPLTFKLHA